MSPHLAAEKQGIRIELDAIGRPQDPEPIIVEGAGGVFVQINDRAFMLDLIRHLGLPVVIAARTTLGTINHTLLTISAIREAGLDLCGVVMIGKENADNERAVEHYGNVPVVGSTPWLESIDAAALRRVFDRRFNKSAFV